MDRDLESQDLGAGFVATVKNVRLETLYKFPYTLEYVRSFVSLQNLRLSKTLEVVCTPVNTSKVNYNETTITRKTVRTNNIVQGYQATSPSPFTTTN